MGSKKGDSSASDVSASGHSDNGNKSKAIATGAAKVFNKLGLKTRPSTTKGRTEENTTRFQIVHTPDKSPIDMPLPKIPTTNEEFYAAISQINAQGHLHGGNGSVEQNGVTATSRKGSQQSQDSQRSQAHRIEQVLGVADEGCDSMVPRTVVTSPTSKGIAPGPKGYGSPDKMETEVDPPVPTQPVTASGNVRPAYARRVASEGVPPRPLSERPMIKYSSLRARPNLQMQHSSMSTPNAQSALPILSKNAPGNRISHNRVNSGERIVRRRPRRAPSIDSTDSDDETPTHRVSSARNVRDSKEKTKDSGVEPTPVQNRTTCYFCQEDCQPGDNLCSKCQSRFQPQEEVFDYSESEYEDIEFEDSPTFSPATEKSRGTSSRLSKRRTARHPRPREKSRGWSEFSSMSQLQQLASRSASTSPTPHVAMELKIVPPQDIKIRTVTSPTRASAGDGRSAMHHIQQALKPRAPPSPGPGPGGQDRDTVRLGKVRSGEIRRVDYPDIIKLKDPSPKQKSFQGAALGHQHQSGDSLKSWLKYYDDGEKSSERGSGSAWSDSADLPTTGRNSAVPTPASTYDRVTSIYDLYASLDET